MGSNPTPSAKTAQNSPYLQAFYVARDERARETVRCINVLAAGEAMGKQSGGTRRGLRQVESTGQPLTGGSHEVKRSLGISRS